MSMGAKIAAWVYGVQAFIVLPWFLGAIYRHEQSLWAWQQYASELRVHGKAGALLGLYLYAIFYAAFIVIPYAALALRFPADAPPVKQSFRFGRLVLSVWFALTFLLFVQPLFAFIRSLPSEVWNGWLLILWVVATIVVYSEWRVLEKLRRRYVARDTQDYGRSH